ncbi:MAG: glycerol acyltransferase, partial [Paludibacter sp.]
MNKKTIKIDIAQVLKNKAPKTKVPKFIVNYLRRIVHEDEFNTFFIQNPGLKNMDFIEAGLNYLNVSIEFEGKENLP